MRANLYLSSFSVHFLGIFFGRRCRKVKGLLGVLLGLLILFGLVVERAFFHMSKPILILVAQLPS